jgi:hypothetical protein
MGRKAMTKKSNRTQPDPELMMDALREILTRVNEDSLDDGIEMVSEINNICIDALAETTPRDLAEARKGAFDQGCAWECHNNPEIVFGKRIRRCLPKLIKKADAIISAIDGATAAFDSEVAELTAATTQAEKALKEKVTP